MAKYRPKQPVYVIRALKDRENRPVLAILLGIPPLNVTEHWRATLVEQADGSFYVWGRYVEDPDTSCCPADLLDTLQRFLE